MDYHGYVLTLPLSEPFFKVISLNHLFLEELHRSEASSRVNEAQFSLPLSTAIQIALVQLLWSWGIYPKAISSHSSGETAAAYAAGALTCRAAIGITYLRGSLTVKTDRNSNKRTGGMMAAGLSRDEANTYISRVTSGSLVVACVNSQSSVTISGDVDAIAELEQVLQSDNVFARRLKVTEAFHSEHMRPTADVFGASLLGLLQPSASSKKKAVIVSSPKTGGRLDNLDALSKSTHWVESMMHPVEFERAFRHMCFDLTTDESSPQREIDVILEVGPHGALGGPIRQLMTLPEFSADEIPYLSCLSRGNDALATMHQLAAELIERGYRVDMDAVNFPHGRLPEVKVLPNLPSYPWNHQNSYWREPRENQAHKRKEDPPHDLLGSLQLTSPPKAPVWRHHIRVSDVPWTRDHRVGSEPMYPGAGFIIMAIEGITQLAKSSTGHLTGYEIKEVEFSQALLVPEDDAGVETRLTMRSCSSEDLGRKDWHEFEIHALSGENTWASLCAGLIQALYSPVGAPDTQHSPESSNTFAQNTWKESAAYTRDVDCGDLWAALRKVGILHGPTFQNMSRIQSRQGESLTSFSIADIVSEMPHNYQSKHIIHPTTLDSVFQAAYTVLPAGGTSLRNTLIPRRVKGLKISSGISSDIGHAFRAHAQLKNETPRSFEVDLGVSDNGGTVLEIQGLAFQSISSNTNTTDEAAAPASDAAETCISWKWEPDIALIDSRWLQENMHVSSQQTEVDLIQDLRRCTVHYIQEAVESLTESNIKEFDEHHAKFYKWMQTQLRLTRENHFSGDSARWLREDTATREALRTRVARAGVNGEMLTRLGPQTPAVLRREVRALELMMEDGLLSRYYVDALKWNRASEHASMLVQRCLHKHPRARVLEIGGGTGGCTQAIFDRLDEDRHSTGGDVPLKSYEFTDVSSGFFEAARERFAAWQETMTFRRLDIESDPTAQGFEPDTYDVIVASQVLHATTDIRQTLRHVRSLLKPGGKLVMVETTRDELDLFFAFGMLPGWWLSKEPERQETPSLTVTLWNRVLAESGFDGVDLDIHDCDNDEFYMLSTIMATAVTQSESDQAHTRLPAVIIHSEAEAPPADWVESLQTSIAKSTGLTPSVATLDNADVSGGYCIFLGELNGPPLLTDANEKQFQQVLSMASKCKGLLWVSRGATINCEEPQRSLHLGLLRTLRNEYEGKQYVSLDIDPSRKLSWTSETLSTITNVFSAALMRGSGRKLDFEYAERGGIVYIPRAYKNTHLNDTVDRWTPTIHDHSPVALTEKPFQQIDGCQLRMDIETPGLIDTLYFREVDEDAEGSLPDGWVEIEPRAFGLNFRDVMVAMGQLETNRVMGFECAGLVTQLSETAAHQSGLQAGDRVYALLTGHWGTRTRAPWTSVVRIPANLDFVQATSIPLVFATSSIALQETARLRRGERVLIHAGAGGVGQAAIQLAQRIGAEVFTTAGTAAKRRFLADRFDIPADHIFSSRDAHGFVAGIASATGGTGVDVVLNSLAGPLLQASFDCLGEFGRFVDIGKRDFERNHRLSTHAFSRGVSFTSLDLLTWQRSRGSQISSTLNAISERFADGTLSPIEPITTYPLTDIERAFRVMQSGQHTGKIVVRVGPENSVPVALKPEVNHQPPTLRPDVSYLVVGGLGGLGRCLCEWLVARGAKHLIVMSRNAKNGGRFLEELVQGAQATGLGHINVRSAACDVSESGQLVQSLDLLQDMPPIRGVIQAAMVLQVSSQSSLLPSQVARFTRSGGRPDHYNLTNILIRMLYFIECH